MAKTMKSFFSLFSSIFSQGKDWAKNPKAKVLADAMEGQITQAGDDCGDWLVDNLDDLNKLDEKIRKYTFGMAHAAAGALIGIIELPLNLDLFLTRAWSRRERRIKGLARKDESVQEKAAIKKTIEDSFRKSFAALKEDLSQVEKLNTDPIMDYDTCEVLIGKDKDGEDITEVHIRRLCPEDILLRKAALHAKLFHFRHDDVVKNNWPLASCCAKRKEWIEKFVESQDNMNRVEVEMLMRDMVDQLRQEMLDREQRASNFKEMIDWLHENGHKVPGWNKDILPALQYADKVVGSQIKEICEPVAKFAKRRKTHANRMRREIRAIERREQEHPRTLLDGFRGLFGGLRCLITGRERGV